MSVSCYFGLTESGKSYHVQHNVIPKWEKVIVFDVAHCFSGEVVENPDKKMFVALFRKYLEKSSFRLIVRPSRTSSDEVLFNQVVHLACSLGRTMGKGIDPAKRLQLVTDEADFVCSSNYQSWELKHLVNKGRHDNVDAHFIARNPNRIHTDLRANTTKIVAFRLANALQIPFFTDNLTREIAGKIRFLEKYSRLEWDATGRCAIFGKNNEILENLSGNSKENFQKRKAA